MTILANPSDHKFGGKNMTPYQSLANAIIEQAAKDYRIALRYHFKHPGNTRYQQNVCEIERFFRSDWYTALTDVEGEYLIREIRRRVQCEVAV